MPRPDHDDRTISSVKRGHLTSVICGQSSSALTSGSRFERGLAPGGFTRMGECPCHVQADVKTAPFCASSEVGGTCRRGRSHAATMVLSLRMAANGWPVAAKFPQFNLFEEDLTDFEPFTDPLPLLPAPQSKRSRV